MSRKNFLILTVIFGTAVFSPTIGWAQVSSGSNGSDGAFNPATNTVINMADHPNGIYQYTTVNIPSGVTVTFIPNANNSPVTWLVQSNVVINGTVDVSGQTANSAIGVAGGPGGWAGGNGGSADSSGQGPGGGSGGASGTFNYGNSFLLPLLGGSGGGGWFCSGGSGGGGAILMAANQSIILNGTINASGGNGYHVDSCSLGGSGSGGGVRLVALNFSGTGSIAAAGGGNDYGVNGGSGRIRIDAFQNNFGGQINGVFTQGFQPIIIPAAGQGVQLSIASVAGASVSASPNGQVASPDAIIPGQQANPISIVVNCSNLPLNTPITVTVKQPANGSSVSAISYNTTGTLASSTATVSIVMPRGGGIIYATAATSN
jgi:hypothetical protein